MENKSNNMPEVMTPSSIMSASFTGKQLAHAHGTADAAVAAGVKARIEARFLIAIRRPRDLDTVRQRVLKECLRPSFAESAMYSVPRAGSRIVGLSIRFAETVASLWTNLDIEQITVFENSDKRIVRVSVVDLENNQSFSRDITIEKSVERKRVSQGQKILGVRTNNLGQQIYLVQATEDEMVFKEGAAVSKSVRTLILRIVPGWLQDEAKEAIDLTLRNKAAEDPDTQKRRIFDAFAAMGVNAVALKEFLGRPDVEVLTADEVVELRELHGSLREGEAKWTDVLAERLASRGEEAKQAGTLPEESRSKVALAKLRAKAKASEIVADKEEERPPATSKAPDKASVDEDEPWKSYLREPEDGG